MLRAALRAVQACRYLIYSEADFEVFAPQGRHVAPMGVKFGVDEGTLCPLLLAKFHRHRCKDKGVGPPKLKFLFRFDRNLEYKRTKFAEFVPHFRMRWVLKFGWICSRGYGVMGVLS